jgi:hypothetical protein
MWRRAARTVVATASATVFIGETVATTAKKA